MKYSENGGEKVGCRGCGSKKKKNDLKNRRDNFINMLKL